MLRKPYTVLITGPGDEIGEELYLEIIFKIMDGRNSGLKKKPDDQENKNKKTVGGKSIRDTRDGMIKYQDR